jgi:hypothetical protein
LAVKDAVVKQMNGDVFCAQGEPFRRLQVEGEDLGQRRRGGAVFGVEDNVAIGNLAQRAVERFAVERAQLVGRH